MKEYNPKEIESKWQKIWEDDAISWQADDNSSKPKFYALFEFPYPSGEGLHMGHLRGQTSVDVYARKKRLEGYNVLSPIGWDAFGLPTENYAIKNKVQPAVATAKNIAAMKAQEKSLGYFWDWPREIDTTDPKYYKWTQWIFLKLFEHGLAYKANLPINWCPSCLIGLANEEVIEDKCERCGSQTEKRTISQWVLRITKYADRLLKGLENIDFPSRVKTQQINWIGRSEGTKVKFKVQIQGSSSKVILSPFGRLRVNSVKNPKEILRSAQDDSFVEVYTTRVDTIFSGTFLILAPEHELLSKFKNSITNISEVNAYIKSVQKKTDLERTDITRDKTGVELKGISAINPANNEAMPVWISDFVLLQYGTGAVFADAHDQRDFDMAKKYNIPLKVSIRPSDNQLWEKVQKLEECFEGDGTLVNSGQFDGLSSADARVRITKWLSENHSGEKAVNYKLRDWIFSRQHYWGEPIPVIYCRKCWEAKSEELKAKSIEGLDHIVKDNKEYEINPLPEKELPVLLPEVEHYEPSKTGESPLAKMTDWVNISCPKCGEPAKRETDTMPNWAGSSWYFLRYIDPENDKELASMDKLKYWLTSTSSANEVPRSSKSEGGIDLYEGGMEHTTLHLLYSRFWNEFLYDIGVVPVSEPYKKRVPHGIILAADGTKMSKSKGNIVSPNDIVSKYGADCTRTYAMFIGPFDQTISWDETGILGVWRFLHKVWENMQKPNGSINFSIGSKLQNLIQNVSRDIEAFSMNTPVAKLMEFNNLLSKDKTITDEIKIDFLKLLYPYAPHISEELNSLISKNPLYKSDWPKYDTNKLINEDATIVIQINSKIKSKLTLPFDSTDKKVETVSMNDEKIVKLLSGKQIKKTIIIKNKLINFVI